MRPGKKLYKKKEIKVWMHRSLQGRVSVTANQKRIGEGERETRKYSYNINNRILPKAATEWLWLRSSDRLVDPQSERNPNPRRATCRNAYVCMYKKVI